MPASNSNFQKNTNIALIASTILKYKKISRSDIASSLSLYRSTVTNIVTYLLENGIVEEGESKLSHSSGGRKAIELSIKEDFGLIISFDIQPSHYRMIIMTLNREILYKEKGFLGNIGLENMVLTLVDKALEKQKELNIPLLAFAFSIPGIVDNERGVVIYSYPFKTTKEINIRELVEKKYKVPVIVENDANAVAWLDISSSNIKNNESALTIVGDYHDMEESDEPYDVGVGFGIIIDGKVYHGAHYASGEFVSVSWKSGSSQSGLSDEILKSVKVNNDSWEAWILDVFSSLPSLMVIMDFNKVILHGLAFNDKERVEEVLKRRCPEFLSSLDKTKCSLTFDNGDEYVSAIGAANVYIYKLFSAPALSEMGNENSINWDNAIALSRRGKEK